MCIRDSYYAEHGAAMLADEPIAGTSAKKGSYIKYQPIGPVLAVMPVSYTHLYRQCWLSTWQSSPVTHLGRGVQMS